MKTFPVAKAKAAAAWLETMPREGHEPRRAELARLPFVIGRGETCDFTIASTRVSREHARIELSEGAYFARDLESTNGTYVNGVRISQSPLADGDLLTVANFGLVFHFPAEARSVKTTQRLTLLSDGEEPQELSAAQLIEGARHCQEAALQRGSRLRAQSIVNLRDRHTIGYEIRSGSFEGELRRRDFGSIDLDCPATRRAGELVRIMALEQAPQLRADGHLFLPVSLAEWNNADFVDSLDWLVARRRGDTQLVVQAPASVADVAVRYAELHGELRELDLQLALDYGGRIGDLELFGDQRPDFIKLAAKTVHASSPTEPSNETMQRVSEQSRRMGIRVVASGMRSDEGAACEKLGIELAQGDYVTPAELLGDPSPTDCADDHNATKQDGQ